MDIYGIHAAQLQGNSHAEYVKEHNTQVAAHNQQAYQVYKNARATATTYNDVLNTKLGAMGAEHLGSGIHALYQGVKGVQQYGSVGKYARAGTSHNLFEITGGKYGTMPMGPNETLARTGAAMKDTGVVKKLGAPISAIHGQSEAIDTAWKEPSAAQYGSDWAARGQKAAEPVLSSAPQAPKGDFTGSLVKEAQAKDKPLGWGTKDTPQSDPTKTMTKIKAGMADDAEATRAASTDHMSLMGKMVKGAGEKVLGEGSEVAHFAGVAAGPLADLGGMALATEDIAENWKKDDTAEKVGDVAGEIGGALGVASAAAPVLAPIAAVVGAVGAIADLIGGIGEESKAKKDQQSALTQSIQTKLPQQRMAQTSTATMTQPTALQKMSGSSSSY